jgi:hypothetical protein
VGFDDLTQFGQRGEQLIVIYLVSPGRWRRRNHARRMADAPISCRYGQRIEERYPQVAAGTPRAADRSLEGCIGCGGVEWGHGGQSASRRSSEEAEAPADRARLLDVVAVRSVGVLAQLCQERAQNR